MYELLSYEKKKLVKYWFVFYFCESALEEKAFSSWIEMKPTSYVI